MRDFNFTDNLEKVFQSGDSFPDSLNAIEEKPRTVFNIWGDIIETHPNFIPYVRRRIKLFSFITIMLFIFVPNSMETWFSLLFIWISLKIFWFYPVFRAHLLE